MDGIEMESPHVSGTRTSQQEGPPAWAVEIMRRLEYIETAGIPPANTPLPTATAGSSVEGPQAVEATEGYTKGVTEHRRRKDRIPDPPVFEGKKSEFQSWLAQVQAKLDVDRSDEPENIKFWYLHSRLGGKALLQITAWVTTAVRRGTASVIGLVDQLRLAFEDTQAKQRAANKLNELQQKKKSFATYIADFERTVLEAGGAEWTDDVKITFLQRGIARDLKQALVATPMPASYAEYCSLLHTTSQNLEALQKDTSRNPSGGTVSYNRRDEMDWEPTHISVSATKATRRAEWVSKEELTKRRENGLCLRCGKDGHFVSSCQLAPAKRPTEESKVDVGATKASSTRKLSVDTEDSDNSDDSGKE
jgi:hypothetical protein